jgi:galactonate dehydratase
MVKITEVKPILCGKHYTFCKIITDEDIVGWGDGTEWATPKGVASYINDFGDMIIGEDPCNVERLWQALWRAVYVGGKDVSAALCAIETALLDIKGKIYDIPPVDLIGGKVWNKVRLYTHCDGATLESTLKYAEQLKREGWTAFKCHPVGLPDLKENSPWMKDSLDFPKISRIANIAAIKKTVEKVRALRETVGDDMDIGIDLNNRLDLPSAMRLAKALEPYNMFFMEDPICQHEDAAPSYKRLADSTSTPIATGENLYTVWQFRSYLERGALDLVLPDICHTGISQGKKIAALAEAYHLPVCPHNPNSPLSAIISGNLACSIPNFGALEILHQYAYPEPDSWLEKIMDPPLSTMIKDGYLTLPEGPGWGVELNEDEIAKHPYIEPCKFLENWFKIPIVGVEWAPSAPPEK